ncbi:hypothetical protein BH11BAC3_BH11BAC3_05360 [soil metagenome]
MLVKEKIGTIGFFALNNRKLDYLVVEWYETNKRILHKKTTGGHDITLKFLNENPQLVEGDVIYEDDFNIVVIEIAPCDTIVIRPRTMFEMASVCYEIGNKHVPLFYENESLLVPFESPLFRTLLASGFDAAEEKRKLLHPLKTSVIPHGNGSVSLFSRIMKLSNP